MAIPPDGPRIEAREGEIEIDFRFAHEWEDSIARLLHALDAGTPPLGVIEGAPELPPYFRRAPAFHEVRDLLLNPDGPRVIAVRGAEGSGKSLLAADLVTRLLDPTSVSGRHPLVTLPKMSS